MKPADVLLQLVTTESIINGQWETLLTPIDNPSFKSYLKFGHPHDMDNDYVWEVLRAMLAIRDGNIIRQYTGNLLFAGLNEYLRTATRQAQCLQQAIWQAMGEPQSAPGVLYRGYRIWDDAKRDSFVRSLGAGKLDGLLSCSTSLGVAQGFSTTNKGVVLEIRNAPPGLFLDTVLHGNHEYEWLLNSLRFRVCATVYQAQQPARIVVDAIH